jgi:drug/metabolite transporter (DMT)-like permease
VLWVVLTLLAAAAQTARNALQRGLTTRHGALGAAHARFLYGLPFAVLFLWMLSAWTGAAPPRPGAATLFWAASGGAAQIVATALLLKAMQSSAFVIAVAYTKSEPVLVLAIAWAALGSVPTALQIGAILLATLGVMLMSWPQGGAGRGWLRALLLGIGAGGAFAVSAVCFRQGIVALDPGAGFAMRATTTLVLALTVQTVGLSAWLVWRRPGVMRGLLADPLTALPAGFCGALASQFWFLAFALQTAPLVRTMGLSEVLFSQIVTRRVFAQHLSRRETAGLAVLCVGLVGLLLGG